MCLGWQEKSAPKPGVLFLDGIESSSVQAMSRLPIKISEPKKAGTPARGDRHLSIFVFLFFWHHILDEMRRLLQALPDSGPATGKDGSCHSLPCGVYHTVYFRCHHGLHGGTEPAFYM